ncbi:hypothetical protein N665_1253s0003 [Sinapis alba]|nr:hypothetical protein N665_1253s0003 [Sinapis alba]
MSLFSRYLSTTFPLVSSDWVSSLVGAPAQANRPPRSFCVVMSRKAWFLLYGWDSTGFETLWGIPHAFPLPINVNCRVPLTLETCFAELLISNYLLLVEEDTAHSSRSGLHKTDLQPSSPYDKISSFVEAFFPSRERDCIRRLSLLDSILYLNPHHPLPHSDGFHRRRHSKFTRGLDMHFSVMGLTSPPFEIGPISYPNASKLTYEWGNSAFVDVLLTAIVSVGPDLYPSSSSHEEKILSMFPLPRERDVSSDSFSSVCFSSFIGLLSCGAVSTGPEDATENTLVFFVDEVWTLTSLYVTILKLSDFVVKALPTHSSIVLNSLSSSIEDLSFLCFLFDVLSTCGQRGCIIPSFYCMEDVSV